MDVRSLLIDLTKQRTADLWRNIRAIPEDRLNWKPAEHARTALDIGFECAQSAKWMANVIKARKFEFSHDALDAEKEARKGWNVDIAEKVSLETSEELYEILRNLSDADLEEKIFLPLGGGREVTIAEMAAMQLWNVTYHLGQVSYIQTLYGDLDMH